MAQFLDNFLEQDKENIAPKEYGVADLRNVPISVTCIYFFPFLIEAIVSASLASSLGSLANI